MDSKLTLALPVAFVAAGCASTGSGFGSEALSVSEATAAPSGLHEVFVYALGME